MHTHSPFTTICITAVLAACSSRNASMSSIDASIDANIDASIDAPSESPQWHIRDVYSVVNNTEYQYTGMAESIGGVLFVVGTYRDPSRNKHWFLRKSDDNGLDWVNTGWDISEPSTDAQPFIAIDSHGNIYVAGNYNRTWTVFKSTDTQGTDFVTVDSTSTIANRGFQQRALIVNANDEVFAIGGGTANPAPLIVRKSDSTGMNWNTILQYSYSPGDSNIAFDSGIDSSGDLFIGARIQDAAGNSDRIVVQHGVNNGTSWTTIEDLQPVAPQGNQERNVLRVLGTKLYLTGTTRDSATNSGEFFVHECDIATTCTIGSWVVSDHQPEDDRSPDDGIFDIGQDPSGTLWINGFTSASINRKKTTTGAWSDAGAEFGDGHFGTYLRTSSNRFFMSGMILNPPNLTAIIMEYL